MLDTQGKEDEVTRKRSRKFRPHVFEKNICGAIHSKVQENQKQILLKFINEEIKMH